MNEIWLITRAVRNAIGFDEVPIRGFATQEEAEKWWREDLMRGDGMVMVPFGPDAASAEKGGEHE